MFKMEPILVATALALLLMSGWQEARANNGPDYIYTHSAQTMTYGQPKELTVIRSRLTRLCTGGRMVTDLGGQAEASDLIQIGRYAIVEGSCGNPELHLVLKKTRGVWQRPPNCGFGGGVVPNFGPFGLRSELIQDCAFPLTVVKKIIAIRSRDPGVAQEDRRVQACAINPQIDVSCAGHKFTMAQQRLINYNRYFTKTTEAVYREDFSSALSYARRARKVEPKGFRDQEMRIRELKKILRATASGAMTKKQALAEWQRLRM